MPPSRAQVRVLRSAGAAPTRKGVNVAGFFRRAGEGVFDRGVGAGIARVGARFGATEQEGAAGGVDVLVGERCGVVPSAELEAGGACFGGVGEFG